MRVILLQDVLHQGKRGDVIDVKPGYARNFLLPQGVALPANDGNLKYFDQLKRKIDVQHEQERGVGTEGRRRSSKVCASRCSSGSTRTRRSTDPLRLPRSRMP